MEQLKAASGTEYSRAIADENHKLADSAPCPLNFCSHLRVRRAKLHVHVQNVTKIHRGKRLVYLWDRCSINESTKCSMGGACSSAWGQSSDGKLANSRSKLKVYDLLTMSRTTPEHDVTHTGFRRSNKKRKQSCDLPIFCSRSCSNNCDPLRR